MTFLGDVSFSLYHLINEFLTTKLTKDTKVSDRCVRRFLTADGLRGEIWIFILAAVLYGYCKSAWRISKYRFTRWMLKCAGSVSMTKIPLERMLSMASRRRRC